MSRDGERDRAHANNQQPTRHALLLRRLRLRQTENFCLFRSLAQPLICVGSAPFFRDRTGPQAIVFMFGVTSLHRTWVLAKLLDQIQQISIQRVQTLDLCLIFTFYRIRMHSIVDDLDFQNLSDLFYIVNQAQSLEQSLRFAAQPGLRPGVSLFKIK